MSRIVVKNLPKKVTADKLRERFGQYGVITDVQLKYTKDGKFRQFAFVGYQKEDEAKSAISNLNNTFLDVSKIEVALCSSLGDSNKPRAWSKHASDSSAFLKRHKETDCPNVPKKVKKEKDKKKQYQDPKLTELITKCKDDPMFHEFMEAHLGNTDFLKEKLLDNAGSESENEAVDDLNDNKVANQNISDMQYLKMKMNKPIESEKSSIKPTKKRDLITIKLCGLPFKAKKKDIKQFLHPIKPYSLRIPVKLKGVAYCGFKTQTEANKALNKNRSFMNGKRIFVTLYAKKENETSDDNNKWKKQADKLKDQESVAESGRIFIRNLSYTVTEDELTKLFEKYGPISDTTVPIDSFTRKIKGFGIITFLIPEHAFKAFKELDGTILHGRMLHLLPGLPMDTTAEDEDSGTGNFKQKKLQKQKANANVQTNWNTLFVGQNALSEVVASTYNTSKENVLSDSNGSAAVRLALGETQVVNKTRDFLIENGVDLDSFTNMSTCKRSKTVILVKNLPFATTEDELREKFSAFGELKRIILPPAGLTAIVEFLESVEAKKAFRRLAYSKFKYLPLYLEWAPEEVFSIKKNEKMVHEVKSETVKDSSKEEKEVETASMEPEDGATLFVKNLNFVTDNIKLKQHFSDCGPIVSAEVAEKRTADNKKLSCGYGFVRFYTKESADKALKTLQFSTLDDHKIELKRSHRTTRTNESTRVTSSIQYKPSTKILVRNIPFQSTQKEIEQLFKVFGQIKSLRLPKKMVGSGTHRGFSFVEFFTVEDAKRAFKALSHSTHLYGRRLVLEWAAADEDVSTLRQKTAHQYSLGNSTKEKKKKVIIEEDLKEET